MQLEKAIGKFKKELDCYDLKRKKLEEEKEAVQTKAQDVQKRYLDLLAKPDVSEETLDKGRRELNEAQKEVEVFDDAMAVLDKEATRIQQQLAPLQTYMKVLTQIQDRKRQDGLFSKQHRPKLGTLIARRAMELSSRGK